VIARAVILGLLCLAIGLFLDSLGVPARGIFDHTWRTIAEVWRLAVRFVDWAVPYTLLGAVVVVPATALAILVRYARRR
jgi:uncharacterized protein DUF6460